MNQNNQSINNHLTYDVIIVGAGIAGMTAAIYLKRAGVDVAMIDANAPGGQLNKIADIENYPGFLKVDGPTLAYTIFEQTLKLGVKYIYAKVETIVDNGTNKIVKCSDTEYVSKAVIIASGRKARELGLENEKKLVGKGISWCAICDGALYKDKEVIIVGGGNSALEGVKYLENVAKSITIVLRRSEFRGDAVLVEKILKIPKVKVIYDSIVSKILIKEGFLSGIEVTNNNDKKVISVKADGLFIYIGFEPASDMYKDLGLDLNSGYISVDNHMRTNRKGIYACGDAIDKEMYQLVTSAGEGAEAAHSVLNDLDWL